MTPLRFDDSGATLPLRGGTKQQVSPERNNLGARTSEQGPSDQRASRGRESDHREVATLALSTCQQSSTVAARSRQSDPMKTVAAIAIVVLGTFALGPGSRVEARTHAVLRLGLTCNDSPASRW